LTRIKAELLYLDAPRFGEALDKAEAGAIIEIWVLPMVRADER
jgi:hypothetical protein